MADRKISEFAATATMADADVLTTVSGGVNKKITWANLQTEIIDDIAMQPLSATAWVVASDANAYTLAYATKLQTAGAKVWICDGTDDQVQIQAAIDYCDGLGGGKVLLSEGTFYIGATITLVDYLVLWGSGIDVTILTLVDSTNANILYGNGKTKVDIGYMTIDGNKANNTSGSSGDPGSNRGIYFNTVTWSRIHDLYIYDTDEACIKFFDSSDYSVIDKVWCIDPNERGIHINDSDYVCVTNCYCEGCVDDDGHEGDGIDIDASDYARVIGNECVGCERHGIFVEQGAHDVTVANNICRDGVGGGGVDGCGIQLIQYHASAYGISELRYITITGNVCSNNYGHGIGINSNDWNTYGDMVEYVTVTSNVCMNNDQGAGGYSGIRLSGDGHMQYIVLSSNVCCDDQGGATQEYGINIAATADRVLYTANICLGNNSGQINDNGTNTEAGHNIVA